MKRETDSEKEIRKMDDVRLYRERGVGNREKIKKSVRDIEQKEEEREEKREGEK